jgi:hypothetical protein
MYFGFESKGAGHQADAEAEIAGAGDDDAMFGKEGFCGGSEQGVSGSPRFTRPSARATASTRHKSS